MRVLSWLSGNRRWLGGNAPENHSSGLLDGFQTLAQKIGVSMPELDVISFMWRRDLCGARPWDARKDVPSDQPNRHITSLVDVQGKVMLSIAGGADEFLVFGHRRAFVAEFPTSGFVDDLGVIARCGIVSLQTSTYRLVDRLDCPKYASVRSSRLNASS